VYKSFLDIQSWNKVYHRIWEHLQGQVWGCIGIQFHNEAQNQPRDWVWESVKTWVLDQVGDQVWHQLREDIGSLYD